MLNQINNIEKANEEIIENFFNIWLLKEFVHHGVFKEYYDTFLDENGEVSNEKIKSKLKEIYIFISEHNVTEDRPNNVSKFSEEKIKHIISNFGKNFEYDSSFAHDILTQIQGNFIHMISEGIIDFNIERDERIDKVKLGLNIYLKSLYSNNVYDIYIDGTIEKIVLKTIEIMKNS